MTRGYQGEQLAATYLQEQGLVLVERNWCVSIGEIDLILWDGHVLVFVEVKYRATKRWGSPLEAVTWRKQQKYRKLASLYLAYNQIQPLCRFDVVGIYGEQVQWVKGAF